MSHDTNVYRAFYRLRRCTLQLLKIDRIVSKTEQGINLEVEDNKRYGN